jgi:hypothetical protein
MFVMSTDNAANVPGNLRYLIHCCWRRVRERCTHIRREPAVKSCEDKRFSRILTISTAASKAGVPAAMTRGSWKKFLRSNIS